MDLSASYFSNSSLFLEIRPTLAAHPTLELSPVGRLDASVGPVCVCVCVLIASSVVVCVAFISAESPIVCKALYL